MVKRCYQLLMYTLSSKMRFKGNILRVSPYNKAECFLGYYDKSSWDDTGRYMLCMKAKDTWSNVVPLVAIELLLIDTKNGNRVRKIGGKPFVECATRVYASMVRT